MSNGLRVENVSVRYGDTLAVDDASFEVGPGHVLALLGPSGCGKSSLLRAVIGLEPLSAGRIVWDDEDLANVKVHKRKFGAERLEPDHGPQQRRFPAPRRAQQR